MGGYSPLFLYMMISKEQIKTLAEERINELDNNLFLVDINVSPTNVIRVELESTVGNVAINDCVSVSRNIEHNLDRSEADFELQVSSAGLDKPFRVKEQFIKNIGEKVKTKLIDGTKIEGLLKSADNNGFIIETTRKERLEGKKKKITVTEDHKINYKEQKETKIIISFK